MRKGFQIFCLLIGLVALFFGIVPLLFGVFHVGVVYMLLYGGLLVAVVLLWDLFDGWGRLYRRLRSVSDAHTRNVPRGWQVTRRALVILLALATLSGTGISAWMLPVILTPPRDPQPQTVIVLGCRAYDGKPSTMLRQRLDRAYDYLLAHPTSVAIVSGGVDEGETISEAQTMYDDLVARGINSSRILLEDRATSSYTNLFYSAEIMRTHGFEMRAVLVSSGFHLPRSTLYAKLAGIDPEVAAAKTPWGLIPGYWVREWAAIARAIVSPG